MPPQRTSRIEYRTTTPLDSQNPLRYTTSLDNLSSAR